MRLLYFAFCVLGWKSVNWKFLNQSSFWNIISRKTLQGKGQASSLSKAPAPFSVGHRILAVTGFPGFGAGAGTKTLPRSNSDLKIAAAAPKRCPPGGDARCWTCWYGQAAPADTVPGLLLVHVLFVCANKKSRKKTWNQPKKTHHSSKTQKAARKGSECTWAQKPARRIFRVHLHCNYDRSIISHLCGERG